MTWQRMHARVISDMDDSCAQPERSFWRIHATDIWATDAHKVWGKSQMRATYIPDVHNPFNLAARHSSPVWPFTSIISPETSCTFRALWVMVLFRLSSRNTLELCTSDDTPCPLHAYLYIFSYIFVYFFFAARTVPCLRGTPTAREVCVCISKSKCVHAYIYMHTYIHICVIFFNAPRSIQGVSTPDTALLTLCVRTPRDLSWVLTHQIKL